MKNLIIYLSIFFICCSFIPFWKTQNKKIILVGINGYNKNDLLVIKRSLSRYTNFSVTIGNPQINNKIKLYKNEDGFYMITDEIQKLSKRNTYFDYDVEEPITIYFTRYGLYNLNRSIKANTYGNQIYLNVNHFCEGETAISLIHEISHNFGLSHCENKCIMGKYNYMIWENTLYYCDRCRPYKPEMIKNVR